MRATVENVHHRNGQGAGRIAAEITKERKIVRDRSCVRYADPNRAPYGWKNMLLVPKPSGAGPGGAHLHSEYSFDTDRPGYVVEVDKPHQVIKIALNGATRWVIRNTPVRLVAITAFQPASPISRNCT